MVINKGEIGIYGALKRNGGDNILSFTEQVYDSAQNKTLESVNWDIFNKFRYVTEHIENSNNPHKLTKELLGLGNVINELLIEASLKGVANGVATLDSYGKVPASLLPSYVDDVLEYSSLTQFPSTGETGKIYVDLENNLTYRWSGSTYIEISKSLALGETSSTAFVGSRGVQLEANLAQEINDRTNADTEINKTISTWTTTISSHISNTDNPHKVTKGLIGLGNVDNTSDKNKPISSATLSALDKKVNLSTTINGHALTSSILLTKTDIGLNAVDNTSDLLKPISTATSNALANKVDKVTGKGLSTNDYTNEDKARVNDFSPCTEDEIKALFA